MSRTGKLVIAIGEYSSPALVMVSMQNLWNDWHRVAFLTTSSTFISNLYLRHPELAAVCRDQHTLILYPGSDAENLEELDRDFTIMPHNIIIIDGTWSQAKDMFLRNTLFRLPKQVSQLQTCVLSHILYLLPSTDVSSSFLKCLKYAEKCRLLCQYNSSIATEICEMEYSIRRFCLIFYVV